jgi:CRISPR-associated protein Cmx8
MLDEYAEIKSALFDPMFRRQRLLNLIQNKPWYAGFDRLLSLLKIEHGLLSKEFQHDVRISFKSDTQLDKGGHDNMAVSTEEIESKKSTCEELILRIIENYMRRKLKEKYGLDWETAQKSDQQKATYREKKETTAKDCFYAIRSRTGDDFINYFASTLCSVPQWMNQESFLVLTRALYEDTERMRTLTMLALAARS